MAKEYKKHLITAVAPGSIAEELELKAGDRILSIGGREIEDVLDYEFMCREEFLELLAETAEGEQVLFEIEKDEDEDLGLTFEEGLMDAYRSCRNKCVFCFNKKSQRKNLPSISKTFLLLTR